MGSIVDLTGKPVVPAAGSLHAAEPTLSQDITNILQHLGYLHQEGRICAITVSVIRTDGSKTKAYAIADHIDPATLIGTVEMLKDMIKKDTITAPN